MYSNELYFNIIRKDLISYNNYKKINDIPSINKIIINVGFKNINEERFSLILLFLELITGVKPVATKAKKSIANFDLKENAINGCKIVLTKDSLNNFLFKLKTFVFPSLKTFIPTSSFDGKGNITIGIKDIMVFPELNDLFELFDISYGMDITFITSTTNQAEAKKLLTGLQIPIKENK